MNKLQTLRLVVVFLLIALVGQYFFYNGGLNQKKGELLLRTKTVEENNKQYLISAEYPQFAKAAPELSEKIEAYVKGKLEDFKKNGNKNNPNQPFTFYLNWSSQQLNDKFISVIIRVESFSGGANPLAELAVFNYDLENQKEVVLSDLFPEQKNYLKIVSNYARDELKKILATEDSLENPELEKMFQEGTAPEEANFANFTFSSQTIKFYFPVYQLGPRTLGEQTVVYPRALITKKPTAKNISNMANPASVNCVNLGGELKIKKDREGGEYGQCLFPNGKICEEWALYRGECSPEN
jgi:uncharacterized protein